MNVLENSQLPKATLPGIEHTTLAASINGLRQLSVWRQTMAAGGATPPHSHACEEVVLVLAGRGRVRLGDTEHAFGPDTTLLIPGGVEHQIFSDGPEPMVTIAVFPRTPVPVSGPDGSALELPWAS